MLRRSRLIRKSFHLVSAVLIGLGCAQLAVADESDSLMPANWYLQGGGYMHYSDDEDYAGTPWFLGIEHFNRSGTITGLSVFENSFGQFSQYLYIGKNWYPWKKVPGFRVKLTGGIVHGYSGEHSDTSPINWGDAWAIGVVPGIGYQQGAFGVDVAILSASGLLFLVGYEF